MSEPRIDKELEQYRSLMEVPSTFEDGFSWTALLGALFAASNTLNDAAVAVRSAN